MKIKKIFFTTILLATVAALVTACGPVYETHYSYVSPKSWRGKQCVNRCLRDRSRCQSRCQRNNQSCRNTANLAAMPAYLSYVEQAKKNNDPVWKNVSDFADYSQCNSSCDCESNYRQCFTNCGGDVIANTQCVAFCPKRQ